MNAEWIKSPTARRVLVHWADARPAWLWSQDGERLVWRNDAARYFHGRVKKHGIKLAPDAVPIKGQIARLIRLGSVGRSSLSRIQLLAGERPISTTCTCTPLLLGHGEPALLIVGVDPIEPDLLESPEPLPSDGTSTSLFPPGADYLVVNDDQITGGSPGALERYAPIIESEGLPSLPEEDSGVVELGGELVTLTRYRASQHDAMLLVFEREGASASIAEVRHEEGFEQQPAAIEMEPLLPLGLGPLPAAEDVAEPVAEVEEEAPRSLSSLFDRLADDEGLFTTLTAADEHFIGGTAPAAVEAVEEPVAAERVDEPVAVAEATIAEPEMAAPEDAADYDVIGALIEYADEEAEAAGEPEAEPEPEIEAPEVETAVTWRVVGRGFVPLAQPEPEVPEVREAEPVGLALGPAPDPETVERVSRYNFDELSRILTDRVNPGAAGEERREAGQDGKPAAEGALINLAGETFILNRLPLGILVFRDQQVLFANRALVELTGHDSIESVRAGGLAAIFPSEAEAAAGPVSQLVRRDGKLLPVNARLQSITWHGRPALMLSASLAETRIGHEGAVRAFAELVAETRDEGYIAADRTGMITALSLHGRIVLGQSEADLVGRPLAALVAPAALPELKAFLELPARFAETARPAITLSTNSPGLELLLFAEGQAGIVSGYFGFARRRSMPVRPVAAPEGDELEPSMLTRISRGVRRPLNSIMGFADLIGAAGTEPERHAEYARDIRTAGEEIAGLVDELDDYARLREGRYPARSDEIELSALLESCLLRVKPQAGAARVLLRNAVSEHLPWVTADRPSLTQALLNLLSSAVAQTPAGGSVIVSAQAVDGDAVVINIRDGGATGSDVAEKFMMFRDGVGKDGEALGPVPSSVGLALTRSLLAVNQLSLSVDPTPGVGKLFSVQVPAELGRRQRHGSD